MLYIQKKAALILLAIACLALAACSGVTPEIKELIVREVARAIRDSLLQVDGITAAEAEAIANVVAKSIGDKLQVNSFDWTPIVSSVLTTGAGLLGLNVYRNKTRAQALGGGSDA